MFWSYRNPELPVHPTELGVIAVIKQCMSSFHPSVCTILMLQVPLLVKTPDPESWLTCLKWITFPNSPLKSLYPWGRTFWDIFQKTVLILLSVLNYLLISIQGYFSWLTILKIFITVQNSKENHEQSNFLSASKPVWAWVCCIIWCPNCVLRLVNFKCSRIFPQQKTEIWTLSFFEMMAANFPFLDSKGNNIANK